MRPHLRLPIAAAVLVASFATAAYAASPIYTLVRSGRGSTNSTTHRSGATALAGFELEFEGNDHKIKSLGIRNDGRTFLSTFADNDGNDDYRVEGQFRPVPMSMLRASGGCAKGDCSVAIQRPPRPGDVFVLRGFEFKRSRQDANIRDIAVLPNPAAGTVHVVFRDGGGGGPLVGVQIDYGYVAGSLVSGTHRASRRRQRGEQKLELGRRSGAAVLQGFDFRFENGDHHLKSFAIEQLGREFRVMFNDNNTDDPYLARVDYALLR